jgi:hypothetical protein
MRSPFLFLSFLLFLCAAPVHADLTIKRVDNWLVIRGPDLPGSEIRINYLEAFCRAGSTDADWVKHTVVGHKTQTRFENSENKHIKLRSILDDGLWVEHDITAGDDEVTFNLTAYNFTDHVNEAEWAQPCVRLGNFAGAETDNPKCPDIKLSNAFIFLDGKLTRMPTPEWATKARYVPGQVWCPKDVPRTDVNPRPLNPLVPSNGLIGCFSKDGKWIFAMAFDPYQELFEGVIQCLHSDFRIGKLQPGTSRKIHGKIYIVPNDVPALLKRYAKDFPEQQNSVKP